MTDRVKGVGGRGVSWREKEILDLLSCWGEEKIQEALRSSHRNFDCFIRVAEEMSLRGHKRSALECRSKTKTMRLEYKRVVAHNNRSGNAPTTCPYFKELDSILRGDASVRPKRVARSMVLQVVSENSRDEMELHEGSEELFSHYMNPDDHGQNRTSTPCDEGAQEDRCGMRPSQDTDVTVDGLDASGESGSTQGTGDNESMLADKENYPCNRNDVNPGSSHMPLAEQSPGTRLANIRSRKRKSAALYSVADKMMSQSSEEHKTEMEERRKEQQEAREWHGEFMRDNREERMIFEQAFTKNIDLLQCAVGALSSLGEAFLQQRQPSIPSGNGGGSPSKGNSQERSMLPKRSCVGKTRDRLTM